MTDSHAAADADLRRLIATLEDRGKEPRQLREAFADFVRAVEAGGQPRHRVDSVEDSTIDSPAGPIPVRIYTPTNASPGAAIALFHGGGWVVGDLETGDLGARALAAELGIEVLSVHYRLAPEHPFPAAFDDCMSVVESLAAGGRQSVYVAGESAGGNLAAAVAIACRDKGVRLAGQFLINALLDTTHTASRERLGYGAGVTVEAIDMFVAMYAGDAEQDDPRLLPNRARSLEGVAPAFVVTAQFDPLVDEGAEYARRLIAADVPIVYQPMPTMMHAWWALFTASSGARIHLDRMMCLARGFVGAYR